MIFEADDEEDDDILDVEEDDQDQELFIGVGDV